jgi:predicted KAP-like P-loop ATPase
MRRLTGREGGGPKLNFLFLIDDLDRCLPESAVKMLESIMLFLDVESCAFVLALDDEVVERGIAHRYRDYGATNNNRALESIAHSLNPDHYRAFNSDHDHVHANPITGSEYLEKIVQLPLRVPAPSLRQVEDYLDTHFNSLFGHRE